MELARPRLSQRDDEDDLASRCDGDLDVRHARAARSLVLGQQRTTFLLHSKVGRAGLRRHPDVQRSIELDRQVVARRGPLVLERGRVHPHREHDRGPDRGRVLVQGREEHDPRGDETCEHRGHSRVWLAVVASRAPCAGGISPASSLGDDREAHSVGQTVAEPGGVGRVALMVLRGHDAADGPGRGRSRSGSWC